MLTHCGNTLICAPVHSITFDITKTMITLYHFDLKGMTLFLSPSPPCHPPSPVQASTITLQRALMPITVSMTKD